MTNLLAQAFQKASQLPENVQDELASELLEERLDFCSRAIEWIAIDDLVEREVDLCLSAHEERVLLKLRPVKIDLLR